METEKLKNINQKFKSRYSFYKFLNYRKYLFLFLVNAFFFQNCIPYLYHVSTEQVKIILNRREISEILKLDNEEQITQNKLILIQQARNFAISELALSPKGGFEYFTKLNRDEVGWNVSASYPLKFESYTWWFPFAGTVPYKGYFDIEKAKSEEDELIEKGLDTRLRITAGYSTLGWFSDPVLSPQLKMTEDELVSLVIHEMSHATVYFPGDSNFNESYASFIEEIGTEKFYRKHFIQNADEVLSKRKKGKLQREIVVSKVRETANKLKSLYERIDFKDEYKLTQKRIIIEDYRNYILANSEKFTKFNPEAFKKIKLNNENFIGILRYHSGTKYFHEKFISVKGNFSSFHTEIEKLKNLSVIERERLLRE